MNYNTKIPLKQDKIQLIIKSFEDGEFEYAENFKDHPTVTQNGRGQPYGTIFLHNWLKISHCQGIKQGRLYGDHGN